jgi:hypothetical protein
MLQTVVTNENFERIMECLKDTAAIAEGRADPKDSQLSLTLYRGSSTTTGISRFPAVIRA